MLSIQPFDPTCHDRSKFTTGVKSVDNYLRFTAKKLEKANMTRVHVACDDQGTVLAFYALNAHEVKCEAAPSDLRNKAPNNGTIPALFLSMFGVHKDLQGQGLGKALLGDALRKCKTASELIGIAIMVVDVIDDGEPAKTTRRREFYLNAGFEPMPGETLRLFVRTKLLDKL